MSLELIYFEIIVIESLVYCFNWLMKWCFLDEIIDQRNREIFGNIVNDVINGKNEPTIQITFLPRLIGSSSG